MIVKKKKKFKFRLSWVVFTFVTIFVGASLIGPISKQIKNIVNNSTITSNVSSAPLVISNMGDTILILTPSLFGIAIIVIGIVVIWGAFKPVVIKPVVM